MAQSYTQENLFKLSVVQLFKGSFLKGPALPSKKTLNS